MHGMHNLHTLRGQVAISPNDPSDAPDNPRRCMITLKRPKGEHCHARSLLYLEVHVHNVILCNLSGLIG